VTRGIPSTTKTKLAEDNFNIATFLIMEFAAGNFYLTDYGSNLLATIEGSTNTYTSSSHFIEVEGTTESSSIQVSSIKLTFSAVDQTFLNLALSDDYLNVQVKIYRAVISEGGAIIGSAWSYFTGRISTYEVTDDEPDCDLEFTIASHWTDFEKVNCRRTNTNSQQRYYPDDTGFEFSSKSIKDLKWGRK